MATVCVTSFLSVNNCSSTHHSRADISVRDNDEMTPLMLAIKAGNVEIITVMLDLGCDIHSEAKNDKSLIVWAIENEYTALLKVN